MLYESAVIYYRVFNFKRSYSPECRNYLTTSKIYVQNTHNYSKEAQESGANHENITNPLSKIDQFLRC